jgi:hypothetical protein
MDKRSAVKLESEDKLMSGIEAAANRTAKRTRRENLRPSTLRQMEKDADKSADSDATQSDDGDTL